MEKIDKIQTVSDVKAHSSVCQGFGFVSAQSPVIMILGTMPSVKSLAESFYYAHPRNSFWPIMQSITQMPIATTEQKVKLITNNHILLWDVLDKCQRNGSLDSAIKDPQANDFEMLFQRYPTLKVVLFNGQKAAQLFQRLVVRKQNLPDDLTFFTMPSTSPANASLKFADKQLFWQEKLNGLL